MKRIYLDQNKWVDLLKARVGHLRGDDYKDVLTVAREATARGWASFPLSQYHYMELSHRRDYQSRLELGGTMVELSRWHAITPPHRLLEAEIDRALYDRFGRPLGPRRVQVFGVGADHSFHCQLTDYRLPEASSIPPDVRRHFEHFGKEVMQAAALVGPPPEWSIPGYEPEAHRKVGRRFATEQQQLREMRRPDGWHRGDRGRRSTSVDVFLEYERDFTAALKLAGLHWGYIYGLGEDGIDSLIRDTPIVYAHRELRRLRHEASQRRWEEGDLADLAALSAAVVYCDVVVTENQWAALMRRAELDEQFGTVVLTDLGDLLGQLLDAARRT